MHNPSRFNAFSCLNCFPLQLAGTTCTPSLVAKMSSLLKLDLAWKWNVGLYLVLNGPATLCLSFFLSFFLAVSISLSAYQSIYLSVLSVCLSFPMKYTKSKLAPSIKRKLRSSLLLAILPTLPESASICEWRSRFISIFAHVPLVSVSLWATDLIY